MTDDLFRRIVLPVASEEDAETTSKQVLPRLREGSEVLAVHVVEKAGGAPDKASAEQREEWADEIFAAVEDELSSVDGVTVETEILYGTDVAKAILDAATEFEARAVVFTPRGGSRWVELLTGDTATNLIANADRPVVVLPDADDGEPEPPDAAGESDPPTDEEGDG
jgi:nucleotide-binding universal stress UspA family protein